MELHRQVGCRPAACVAEAAGRRRRSSGPPGGGNRRSSPMIFAPWAAGVMTLILSFSITLSVLILKMPPNSRQRCHGLLISLPPVGAGPRCPTADLVSSRLRSAVVRTDFGGSENGTGRRPAGNGFRAPIGCRSRRSTEISAGGSQESGVSASRRVEEGALSAGGAAALWCVVIEAADAFRTPC